MTLFSKWRAHSAPASKPKMDIFGRCLPFNEELESACSRYNVWRTSPTESDASLARRGALEVCMSLERQVQIKAELERDLDLILQYER
jgi:hypothetical protein